MDAGKRLLAMCERLNVSFDAVEPLIDPITQQIRAWYKELEINGIDKVMSKRLIAIALHVQLEGLLQAIEDKENEARR